MTGAQVKLGVLKPIDLREILNWARICGGQEWKNRVAYLATMGRSLAPSQRGDDFRRSTRRLASITDDRQCDDRTERRPAEMPAAQHPEIADHSEAVHQAHRDDDPVTGGD